VIDTLGPRATDKIKWGRKAVLGGALVAAAGSQLRDSVDTNVQEFELLSNDALRHTPTQVHHKPHTAVLRESEDMDTHALLPMKGTQRADRGSEPFGFSWVARARRPQPSQEGTGVTNICNKNDRFIRKLCCW
jgi:hypothetical protein